MFDANQDKTRFLVVVEAKSRAEVARLTREQTLKEMLGALIKAMPKP